MERRLQIFNELRNNGSFQGLAVSYEHAEQLIRLLDTVVIKLEGGTAADIETANEEQIRDEAVLDLLSSEQLKQYEADKKAKESSAKLKEEAKKNAESGTEEENAAAADGDEQMLVEQTPSMKRALLHKTRSLYFRMVPSSVPLADLCKQHPGFIRLAFTDPVTNSRGQQLHNAWATYRWEVDIIKTFWALRNATLNGTFLHLDVAVNRDLGRRVLTADAIPGLSPGLASHRAIVQNDIRQAAKLVVLFDMKAGYYRKEAEEGEDQCLGGVHDYASLAYLLETAMLRSANPLLANISQHLVEELSAEEEHNLARVGQPINQKMEQDKQSTEKLDMLILYLRIVHSVDFYVAMDYPLEDKMPHRLALFHVRGRPPHPSNDQREHFAYTERDIPLLPKSVVDAHIQTFNARLEPQMFNIWNMLHADSYIDTLVEQHQQQHNQSLLEMPIEGQQQQQTSNTIIHNNNVHQHHPTNSGTPSVLGGGPIPQFDQSDFFGMRTVTDHWKQQAQEDMAELAVDFQETAAGHGGDGGADEGGPMPFDKDNSQDNEEERHHYLLEMDVAEEQRLLLDQSNISLMDAEEGDGMQNGNNTANHDYSSDDPFEHFYGIGQQQLQPRHHLRGGKEKAENAAMAKLLNGVETLTNCGGTLETDGEKPVKLVVIAEDEPTDEEEADGEEADGEEAGSAKRRPCDCPNCMNGVPKSSLKKGREHVCHIQGCDKAYGKTSHLRAHLRSHEGNKPFGCDVDGCPWRFTHRGDLEKHRRTHKEGEGKFICSTCGKKFMQEDRLAKHVQKHIQQAELKEKNAQRLPANQLIEDTAESAIDEQQFARANNDEHQKKAFPSMRVTPGLNSRRSTRSPLFDGFDEATQPSTSVAAATRLQQHQRGQQSATTKSSTAKTHGLKRKNCTLESDGELVSTEQRMVAVGPLFPPVTVTSSRTAAKAVPIQQQQQTDQLLADLPDSSSKLPAASVRIPGQTELDGNGYFEDRRPSSNCDQYQVTATLVRTTSPTPHKSTDKNNNCMLFPKLLSSRVLIGPARGARIAPKKGGAGINN